VTDKMLTRYLAEDWRSDAVSFGSVRPIARNDGTSCRRARIGPGTVSSISPRAASRSGRNRVKKQKTNRDEKQQVL
jgi:hypothetical protein